jgi:uncharacterized membrane protein
MDKETIAEKEANIRSTERLEAFSDGVFAIAITLLILDIKVPEFEENETLMHMLSHEWASILALLIGFFTILVCWINHHYMFTIIERCNSKLLLINGFKLLVVTVTPFATALLSKHIETGWISSAVTIYAINFAFMGLAMTCVWCYAHFMGFTKGTSTEVLTATTRLYIFASLLSITIVIVSFFSITAWLVLFFIMFLIFVFPEKIVAWQLQRSR